MLGFLRRNLRIASKTQAYEAMVRPHLGMPGEGCPLCLTVGCSVFAMLHELSWKTLAWRRERARLCMMVVHGLVDIPWLQNKVRLQTHCPQEDLLEICIHIYMLVNFRNIYYILDIQLFMENCWVRKFADQKKRSYRSQKDRKVWKVIVLEVVTRQTDERHDDNRHQPKFGNGLKSAI